MSLRPAVWLTAWVLLNFVAVQTSLVSSGEVAEYGKNQVLVGPRDAGRGNESECEEGEYEEDDGCQPCLLHDAPCDKRDQCCSVDNMACYQTRYESPKCLCHPNFAWDSSIGECYPVDVPPILLVTAYVALGMACVVAVAAISVHSVHCVKRQWRRFRGRAETRERRQFRQGQRQNARLPPRPRRLSSLVPREPVSPLPSKPPTYEDVFGVTTSSLPRAATGSIRSLPPAYDSLSEDPESPPEPEVESPQVVTSQGPQSEVVGAEENHQDGAQPCVGVDNPAFSTEHHM